MILDTENLKISKWSIRKRMEALKEMDDMLRDLHLCSRDLIWRDYGGALKATPEETFANWERIAKDDEAFLNAIFCYMVCTLEPYTLSGFKEANFKQKTNVKLVD